MLLWNGDVLRNAAIQGLLSDLSDIWSENNLSDAYGERFPGHWPHRRHS